MRLALACVLAITAPTIRALELSNSVEETDADARFFFIGNTTGLTISLNSIYAALLAGIAGIALLAAIAFLVYLLSGNSDAGYSGYSSQSGYGGQSGYSARSLYV